MHTLKLHPQVQMQVIDAEGGSPTSYLIRNPAGLFWTVPESYYKFLMQFDGTRTLEDLQAELDSGTYGPLTGCRVTDVVERLMRPTGLLDEELVAPVPSFKM
jgi:hypothetical protein